MNIEQAKSRILAIRQTRDVERQLFMQYDFYEEIIREVALGHPDAQQLAAIAVQLMDF